MKVKGRWIHKIQFLPASLGGKEKMQMDAGYKYKVFYSEPSEAIGRSEWTAGSKMNPLKRFPKEIRRFLL